MTDSSDDKLAAARARRAAVRAGAIPAHPGELAAAINKLIHEFYEQKPTYFNFLAALGVIEDSKGYLHALVDDLRPRKPKTIQ